MTFHSTSFCPSSLTNFMMYCLDGPEFFGCLRARHRFPCIASHVSRLVVTVASVVTCRCASCLGFSRLNIWSITSCCCFSLSDFLSKNLLGFSYGDGVVSYVEVFLLCGNYENL